MKGWEINFKINYKRPLIICLFLSLSLFSPAEEESAFSIAPLFYAKTLTKEEYEYNALFSLIHIGKREGIFISRASPLGSYLQELKDGVIEKRFYFLWPLITFKSTLSADSESYNARLIIFPLGLWREKETPVSYSSGTQLLPVYFASNQGEGRKYFILFPVFWWGRDVRVFIPFYSPRRQSFFGIFPFYGKFKGLWGRDEIRFYLWPLLTHSQKKDLQSLHFPWPFLGIYRGKGGKGAKFWPIFAYLQKPLEAKAYFFWPLGHYRKILKEETKAPEESLKIFLPFYASIDKKNYKLSYYFPVLGREETPKRISKSYFFPLFITSYFPKEEARRIRLLGFFLQWQKGKTRQIYELLPLFRRDLTPQRVRSYLLFPLYNYNLDKDPKIKFSRRYLFPLLIARDKEWLVEKKREKHLIVVPFFGYLRQKDGSSKFRLFWFWWYTTAEAIEQNFSPLWTVFERRKDPQGNLDLRLFWHIFSYQRKNRAVSWEINPFILSWKRSAAEKRIALLGGLLGFEKKAQQKATIRFFYLPLHL